ncbi:transcription-repair coupling factor [Guggenheimella bovis]
MDLFSKLRIPKEQKKLSIDGVSESFDSLLFHENFKGTTSLILTPDQLVADRIYEDLTRLGENPLVFQAKEILTTRIYAQSTENMLERAVVLESLLEEGPKTVIASVRAAAERIVDPEVFKGERFRLEVGSEFQYDVLLEKLVRLGYERVQFVNNWGEFSARGDIVDLFLPGEKLPFRIEFFGDEVDSLRAFEWKTQLSTENVESITIFPALESFTTPELEELFQVLPEEVRENPDFSHERDKYLTLIDKAKTIFDYCAFENIVLIERGQLETRLESLRDDFLMRFEEALEKGQCLPEEEKNLLSLDELNKELERFSRVELTNFKNPSSDIHFDARRNESFQAKLPDFTSTLLKRDAEGYTQVIFAGEKKPFIEGHFKREALHLSPNVHLLEGALHFGFTDDTIQLSVYTERDIFGVGKTKRRKHFGENSERISSFFDLKPGDFVVHLHHGIGCYEGIETKSVEGVKRDYLSIRYAKGDRLFVPTDHIDLVQRYIGGELSFDRLTRLGTNEWKRKTDKAKKSIEDLTDELIKLYAERESQEGYRFSPDTPWQNQFELDFPYEETPDQLRSIEEIKRDMESVRPMDRLLCGDVGFGKTEVALRAIFKAVMDGKQACFLVPTTILASQHYETIKKRFQNFPVNVGMLSRLTPASVKRGYLEKLKKGSLDIVVGTHMLLGKDVQFKDLGLLVIDEEQRFGVKHKEQIKKLKTNVDTLSMSATPIPRTLNMSLSGIRDMSLLQDPPLDRYPVQTYILEYDESILREAVLREIERGGQVYYIFNNVQEMERRFRELQALLPEVSMAYANGQMGERLLENAMLGFVEKKFQLLLSSTIVETGLDISNVNTILIEDAQNFGLSQLYQLRGRVGRTNRIAYAYLFYPRNLQLTKVAVDRLNTIKEFTSFGSGFKIAIRDLEIRGSGNVLGSSQSGQFEEIGYELYMDLLKNRMDQIRGISKPVKTESSIDVDISAFIPDEYVNDTGAKMDLYKRIRAIQTAEDKLFIEEEMIDRFGTPPESVTNLVLLQMIRSKAETLGFKETKSIKLGFELVFDEEKALDTSLVSHIFSTFKDVTIQLKRRPHIVIPYRYKPIDRVKDAEHLEHFLDQLILFKSDETHYNETVKEN